MKPKSSLEVVARSEAQPLPTADRWVRIGLGITSLVLATALASRSVRAEGTKEDRQAAREYDERLRAQRAEAERRSTDTSRMTAEQLANFRKQEEARKDKAEKQANLAEFKEMTKNNLDQIKEMDKKAETAWKEGQFAQADSLYHSIALATVPGSETYSEKARNRIVELEDKAKALVNEAEDLDTKQDFVKEVETLGVVVKQFPSAKIREVALRRLISLKSRPDVAGYVELAQAEGLEAEGRTVEAVNLYTAIAGNPRYEHSVPALKASRKLDELNKDEATREKIKAEITAKADKEAPVLLASAKNYVSNNRPKQAIEKLQQVVEKFPESQYAEQAKKQIDELKAIDQR